MLEGRGCGVRSEAEIRYRIEELESLVFQIEGSEPLGKLMIGRALDELYFCLGEERPEYTPIDVVRDCQERFKQLDQWNAEG